MQTQEVTIKPHVRVVMQSDTELLDEVVVVAYGIATKRSFTGSAPEIKYSSREDTLYISTVNDNLLI